MVYIYITKVTYNSLSVVIYLAYEINFVTFSVNFYTGPILSITFCIKI